MSRLNGHVRIPVGERPCTSTECKKSFIQKSSLVRHRRIHSGERPREAGAESFVDRGAIQLHIKLHKEEKSYPCTKCEKCFIRKAALGVHMAVHTGVKPYVCTACEKRFVEKGSLTRHMMTHRIEKLHVCEICGKSFVQKTSLIHHIRSHTGERPYTCPKCGKSFIRNTALTRHLTIHEGQKPYFCTVCDKSFPQKTTLTRHMRIHTGERPYICTVCEKSFGDKSKLNLHTKIHTGEKSHTCTECKMSFVQQSTLKRHMVVHTGERRYKCTQCMKSFTQKHILVQHNKVHADKEHGQYKAHCPVETMGPFTSGRSPPTSERQKEEIFFTDERQKSWPVIENVVELQEYNRDLQVLREGTLLSLNTESHETAVSGNASNEVNVSLSTQVGAEVVNNLVNCKKVPDNIGRVTDALASPQFAVQFRDASLYSSAKDSVALKTEDIKIKDDPDVTVTEEDFDYGGSPVDSNQYCDPVLDRERLNSYDLNCGTSQVDPSHEMVKVETGTRLGSENY